MGVASFCSTINTTNIYCIHPLPSPFFLSSILFFFPTLTLPPFFLLLTLLPILELTLIHGITLNLSPFSLTLNRPHFVSLLPTDNTPP